MADLNKHRTVVRALVPRRFAGPDDDGSSAEQVVTWLERVCGAAAEALPASGVGVSLMTDGGALGVAAVSDPTTDSLGRLQFSLGEGPCIDAFTSHRPVLEPDLATVPTARWPGYSPAASALGVRSVFSFPLQVGATGLGAMDVYRRTTGPLSPEGISLALAFADVVVETLLDVQDGLTGAEPSDGLSAVLNPQLVVYQAQGMTMVDLGVSLGDALARLRAHAFAEGRPLHDVARDVVDGRLRLEPDAP